jgi:hypothetical protein
MKRIVITPSAGKKVFVVTTINEGKIEVATDEKTDEDLENEVDDFWDLAKITALEVAESFRTSDGFQIVARVA